MASVASPNALYGQDRRTPRGASSERFLSQPFFVAEAFTGRPGTFAKPEDTVRGFQQLVEGELDELPEQAFYICGPIEEAIENAEKMVAGV